MGNKKKVLYVDYATDFGGSPISLSEHVGMIPEVTPIIVTFQKSEFIGKLFSRFKHYQVTRWFSFGRKQRYIHFILKLPLGSYLLPVAMKFYAAGSLLYAFVMSRWLVKIIKKENIDFVHLNNGPSPEAIKAAKLANVPCIMHCRGELLEKDVVNEAFSPIVGCIGISTFVSESIVRYGFKASQVRTIFNSINFDKYQDAEKYRDSIREKFGINQKEVVIGIFGRVAPWKGQLEFLKGFRQLLQSDGLNVKALIVGGASDNDPKYMESLRDYCSENGLVKKVFFTGFINDVEKYYHAVDIVVHASIEPEPFGRVIIEAMASRKPIVAANDGGPVELICDGDTGFLVDPLKPKEMASALENLCRSADLMQQISRRALAYALENFTKQQTAEKIREVYLDCGLIGK